MSLCVTAHPSEKSLTWEYCRRQSVTAQRYVNTDGNCPKLD